VAGIAVRFQHRLELTAIDRSLYATCPRDGSFSLASSGNRKIVHLSIVYSVASKRIVGTFVR
jgi:L-2-hydroxyglutarate oxidase LhgO